MALNILIQRITKGNDSAASTVHEQYKIQAQDFNVSYDRSPISAPLPGGSVLLFDLGQTRVNISSPGVVNLAANSCLKMYASIIRGVTDAVKDKDSKVGGQKLLEENNQV